MLTVLSPEYANGKLLVAVFFLLAAAGLVTQ